MIEYIYYDMDILADSSDGIVIPVNTVGVPGAGLALVWAKKYPGAASLYKTACKSHSFGIGNILVVKTTSIDKPLQHFLCFPTKVHWCNPSRMEYIEAGLSTLLKACEHLKLESIAVPALGCGRGGLKWRDIHPVIEHYLGALKIRVRVYPPK